MLAHPHLLRGDTDEMDELRAGNADHREQECREPRQRIAAPSENPEVRPGIEIMLHRQEKDPRRSATSPELGAIGVLFPAHAAQQFPIGGTKRDQITTAAMIRTEDELVRRELGKRLLDVVRVKTWAIPSDRDHLVIAELRDSLDRVFKTRREIPACLSMHVAAGDGRIASRREKMDIDRRRNFKAKRGKIEEGPGGDGERAPRQLHMRFVGEDENGSSGHAFGYETATVADKHFRRRSQLHSSYGFSVTNFILDFMILALSERSKPSTTVRVAVIEPPSPSIMVSISTTRLPSFCHRVSLSEFSSATW